MKIKGIVNEEKVFSTAKKIGLDINQLKIAVREADYNYLNLGLLITFLLSPLAPK